MINCVVRVIKFVHNWPRTGPTGLTPTPNVFLNIQFSECSCSQEALHGIFITLWGLPLSAERWRPYRKIILIQIIFCRCWGSNPGLQVRWHSGHALNQLRHGRHHVLCSLKKLKKFFCQIFSFIIVSRLILISRGIFWVSSPSPSSFTYPSIYIYLIFLYLHIYNTEYIYTLHIYTFLY